MEKEIREIYVAYGSDPYFIKNCSPHVHITGWFIPEYLAPRLKLKQRIESSILTAGVSVIIFGAVMYNNIKEFVEKVKKL